MTVDRETLRRGLAQTLESLKAAGIRHLPAATGSIQLLPDSPATGDRREWTDHAAAEPPESQPAAADSPQSSPLFAMKESEVAYGTSIPHEQRSGMLDVIRNEVATCTLCPALADSRTQTVFGVGNPDAQLCFVGEAPGADEDRKGEPFVGAAGQLLDRILAACKLSRDDVFILNTLKCRPPGNRNPADSEIQNCWQFGLRQLEIIQPEFICCLGSVAANVVLEKNQSVGKLRGQFHTFRGSRVIVTYHPAYLLRNASAKRQVWEDMKLLMAEMGREL